MTVFFILLLSSFLIPEGEEQVAEEVPQGSDAHEHCFNPEKPYGYRKCKDRESFVRDLRALYEKQLLPLVSRGLCGAIYTQVSDVEDEINGLLSFDRAVEKLRPEEFADLARRLQHALEL